MSSEIRAIIADGKNVIVSADLDGDLESITEKVMTKALVGATIPELDELIKPVTEKAKAQGGAMSLAEIAAEINKVIPQEKVSQHLRTIYRDSFVEVIQEFIRPLAEKAADEILKDGADDFIQGQASAMIPAMAATIFAAVSKNA